MYIQQPTASISDRYPMLSAEMEVIDQDHVDGVIDVLRRAPSGTLRTSSGAFVVHRDEHDEHDEREEGVVLTLEDCDLDPASLNIDALEINFGEAIFSVDPGAIHVSGNRLRVTRPSHVYSTGRRGIELRPGSAWLRVQWGEAALELAILELAIDELVVAGFAVEAVDLQRHRATVVIDQAGAVIEVPCEVSFGGYGRGSGDGGEARMQVHTDSEHRPDLVRAYSHFRFPRLFDRGALAADEVVELFRASHYLDLRETENDEPTEVWCCPDFAGDLSIDSVYRSEDEVLLGHVSVTRAYSRTWLGHQLSTLKGHPESAACRVALYNHFASVPTIMDGREDVYLLGYFDRGLRWHKLFFEGFVDWIGDQNLVTVAPFDRFEPAELGAPTQPIEPGDYVIEPATPQDLAEAVALIRTQLPKLAAEAFDISEELLVAEYLHDEYQRRGVERGRTVLVAREHGEIVGVALCETGSSNLSLFNLFNLAQVYNREQISTAAHAALFRAVRGFYSARGTHDPVVVAPPQRFKNPGSAGLCLDETMGCIIWSGRTLEQYQSYVRYCFEKVSANSLTKAG